MGGGEETAGGGGWAHPMLYLALLLQYACPQHRLSHSKILAKEAVGPTVACNTHAYEVVSSVHFAKCKKLRLCDVWLLYFQRHKMCRDKVY